MDKKESDRLLKKLEEKRSASLKTIDFFCATLYYELTPEGERKPLKFDYAFLRFAFYNKTMELLIVHERGPQRIPYEDLTIFLTNHINTELKQRKLKT